VGRGGPGFGPGVGAGRGVNPPEPASRDVAHARTRWTVVERESQTPEGGSLR
jgi:hypothetical protein